MYKIETFVGGKTGWFAGTQLYSSHEAAQRAMAHHRKAEIEAEATVMMRRIASIA
jgi:hypothetical protein